MEQSKNMEFAARIVRLRLDLPLRNAKPVDKKDVAEEANISIASYSNAENGFIPGDKILRKIALFYGVSVDYLLGNEPGKDKTGGKTVPKKETTEHIRATSEQPFKISDDLMKASRVLESGTSYAAALHLNIVHFDRAVTAEEKIARLEAENMEIRRKNANLESRVAELEAKMERLLEEVVPEKKRQAL